MKTPINRQTIRRHMVYNSWKYILSIVLICIVWNLAFTMTAYRSPANLVVDTYVYGLSDVEKLQSYVDTIHENEMSDMEQMQVQTVLADETYGSMILMTRMAAGEGNLYLLPKAEFQSYASDDAFVRLDELEGLQEMFEERGINLERGTYRDETSGERHLYAIPSSCLPGLQDLLGVTTEYYLSIKVNNGNEENTLKFFYALIRDTIDVKTETAE